MCSVVEDVNFKSLDFREDLSSQRRSPKHTEIHRLLVGDNEWSDITSTKLNFSSFYLAIQIKLRKGQTANIRDLQIKATNSQV